MRNTRQECRKLEIELSSISSRIIRPSYSLFPCRPNSEKDSISFFFSLDYTLTVAIHNTHPFEQIEWDNYTILQRIHQYIVNSLATLKDIMLNSSANSGILKLSCGLRYWGTKKFGERIDGEIQHNSS